MPEIWVRDVDHPRSEPFHLTVTRRELAAIDGLPRGMAVPDPDDHDLLVCGPLSGMSTEVGHARQRYRVRWGPCCLPSCACALEAWSANRSEPVPAPGWVHCETEESCVCGNLERDFDRYGFWE